MRGASHFKSATKPSAAASTAEDLQPRQQQQLSYHTSTTHKGSTAAVGAAGTKARFVAARDDASGNTDAQLNGDIFEYLNELRSRAQATDTDPLSISEYLEELRKAGALDRQHAPCRHAHPQHKLEPLPTQDDVPRANIHTMQVLDSLPDSDTAPEGNDVLSGADSYMERWYAMYYDPFYDAAYYDEDEDEQYDLYYSTARSTDTTSWYHGGWSDDEEVEAQLAKFGRSRQSLPAYYEDENLDYAAADAFYHVGRWEEGGHGAELEDTEYDTYYDLSQDTYLEYSEYAFGEKMSRIATPSDDYTPQHATVAELKQAAAAAAAAATSTVTAKGGKRAAGGSSSHLRSYGQLRLR